MLRKRTLLYAALALAVPLPAFALSGGGGTAAADLAVSASLDGCGVASTSVVCKIDASWNAIPGATRYTASVTSPDGSVSDQGAVSGTGASFWVPYVGNGTCTVTVSAWGTPPGSDKPRLLAKGDSGPGGGSTAPARKTGDASVTESPANPGAADPGDASADPATGGAGCEPGATEPAGEAVIPAPEGESTPPSDGTTTTSTPTTTTSTTVTVAPDPGAPGTDGCQGPGG